MSPQSPNIKKSPSVTGESRRVVRNLTTLLSPSAEESSEEDLGRRLGARHGPVTDHHTTDTNTSSLKGIKMSATKKKKPARRSALGLESLEGRQLLTAVPTFHSLAGARASLYLDFDGYDPSGVTPFSLDADRANLTTDEQDMILEICQRVAEDYSPFNIDVTTVEPAGAADGQYVRVAIGNTGGYPGDAEVGTFRDGNSNNNTARVQAGDVSDMNSAWHRASQWAVTVSHEAGHVLGLGHQSSYDSNGKLVHEYDSGTTDKAPIMGSYYPFMNDGVMRIGYRATWSEGPTYAGPNSIQNDIQVIAGDQNGFGFRKDEAGRDFDKPRVLQPSAGTATIDGVIAKPRDKDYYAFDTTGGTATINVAVTHVAHENYWPNLLAANLDSTLKLYRDNGTSKPTRVLTASPSDSLEANINVNLAAGRYFVVVGSKGEAGDVGQYKLRVTAPFVPSSVPNGRAGSSDALANSISRPFQPTPDGSVTGMSSVAKIDIRATAQPKINNNTPAATTRRDQRKTQAGARRSVAPFSSPGRFTVKIGSLKQSRSDPADRVVVSDAPQV